MIASITQTGDESCGASHFQVLHGRSGYRLNQAETTSNNAIA